MNHAVDPIDRAAMLASMSALAFLRRPRDARGHREWLHFCVHHGDLDVIFNVSLVEDPRVRTTTTRVLVVVRSGSNWCGDLEDVAPAATDLRGGQLHVHAGAARVELRDEALAIRGATRDGAIAFDLELVPESFVSLARDLPLGRAAHLSWLVVPRLAASGTVTIAGDRHDLMRATAYHDHNWGRFGQRDVGWQWGHAHAGEHTVVVARVLDRAQTTSLLQTMMLWSGVRIARIFRGDEVALEPDGFLRPERVATIPAAAAPLVRGATEVPRVLRIAAAADGEQVSGTFRAASVARVVVPDLDDLSTTVIHEVAGRLELAGTVHDRAIAIDTPAIFEFLRSAT